MGFSGAGLYDDDAGADVRNEYRELLGDGVSGEQATDQLIAEWGEALDDPGEANAFWLALADTQWRVGRLEERVRKRAETIIAGRSDLTRFAHDRGLLTQRVKVLDDLATRLATPQRTPVRIRPVFRSVSPVGLGDIFSYELDGGDLVFLRVVAITGDERDNHPTVEALDWVGPQPPPAPMQLGTRRAVRDWPDMLKLIRYPRDPDPAARIAIIAKATPITRRNTLPALMTPWTNLAEDLELIFGSRLPDAEPG